MEAAMKLKLLVCLKCGSSDIRRSKRHCPLEWVLKRFFIVPWRCMVCYNRLAILRIVYPARDSEALAPVGDVPHCVKVLLFVYDPVLPYCAWIATLQCARRAETPGSPQNNSECRPVFGKIRQQCAAEPIVRQ